MHAYRAHPDISVQITYIRTQGQKLALARDEIDVGFMIGPLEHQDFASLHVSDERLIAVLPIDHWLVTRPRLFLRDLADNRADHYATIEAVRAFREKEQSP